MTPFLFIAGIVVGLDRLTKWLVDRFLPPGHDVHIVGEWVMLTHIKNTGAAFGLFPGSVLLLIAISIIASIVVIYMAWHSRARTGRLLTLGLILGGAVGNLIDRVYRGRVTDFINVGLPDGARWPVFNVADSAVTIGVALLAFAVYFRGRGADEEPAAAGPAAIGPSAPPEEAAAPGPAAPPDGPLPPSTDAPPGEPG